MDFSQSTGSVGVGTNTVLNTVQVTCPTDSDAGNFAGYLVATASSFFAGLGGLPSFSYYLKKDNVFAGDHRYFFSADNGDFELPASIQRVDSYNEGQTVTYRFQANLTSPNPGDGVFADKPRLVVVFYNEEAQAKDMAGKATTTPAIRYEDGALTVHIDKLPLGQLLHTLETVTGARLTLNDPSIARQTLMGQR